MVQIMMHGETRGRSEIPQRAEDGNAGLLTPLHDLRVTLVIGSDEDDLSLPFTVGILDELHNVGAATTLLTVPTVTVTLAVTSAWRRNGFLQAETLRAEVVVNEFGDGRTEGLLLVGADPDEIPVRALDAG
jgi:hypothetical protein